MLDSVSVLDLSARRVVKMIPISSEIQRIALSADERLVFTADQTQPRLAVVDTASNSLQGFIPLPAIGYGMSSTEDGRWLLVALRVENKLAVVDLSTRKVAHLLDVPKGPTEVLIRPGSRIAYVSCGGDGQVAEIDTETGGHEDAAFRAGRRWVWHGRPPPARNPTPAALRVRHKDMSSVLSLRELHLIGHADTCPRY